MYRRRPRMIGFPAKICGFTVMRFRSAASLFGAVMFGIIAHLPKD